MTWVADVEQFCESLLDGLNILWLDVCESELTRSPMSKDGRLESLKAFVEGLRAELHSHFTSRVGGAS